MTTSTPPAPAPASPVNPDPLPQVRNGVRSLLLRTPAFAELPPQQRRELAAAMVRIGHAAALLLREELDSEREFHATRRFPAAPNHSAPSPTQPTQPLARAQAAGEGYSGVSAERVAGTTAAILNAVSFPRFVTDLINGVFKAMIDSSVTQMNAYVQLLNDVAASAEGFTEARLGPTQARAWLVERYPDAFEVVTDEDAGASSVRLREGASMPSAEALRTDLGLGAEEPAPSGDPEATLLPLVRRQLAKQRQGMLATMVMLGMQRIVVDSGRITAAMRFHIDTRSAAEEERANRLGLSHSATASARFGFGNFGFSGTASHSIGYVSTQRQQSTEEMNTDLELNSSVEVNFRTDFLPLDRMTTADRVRLIQTNTLNPAAEAAQNERARRAASAAAEQARRDRTVDLLKHEPLPAPPRPGEAGSPEAAEKAKPATSDQPKEAGKADAGGVAQPAETKTGAKPVEKPAGSTERPRKVT